MAVDEALADPTTQQPPEDIAPVRPAGVGPPLATPGEIEARGAADRPPFQGTPYTPETIAGLPTPAELLGEGFEGLTQWRTAPLLTDSDRAYREIASTLGWIDEENPILVSDLMRTGWAIMTMPEIIAGTRSQFGLDNGEAVAMMEALVPDLPDWTAEKVEAAIQDSPLVMDFFRETTHMWKADERAHMMLILATLPAKDQFGFHRRDAVVSLAMQYLRDGDHDLSKTDQRLRFFQQFYQWGRQQQQEYLANMGGISFLGEGVSVPFRWASRSLNSLIFDGISEPEEWKWREALSIGQNTAVSMGIEPGDSWAWTLTSGALDGVANIVIDPINLLAGLGVGHKLAKTIPAVGKLGSVGRLSRGFRAAIPYVGRVQSRLPKFSRSLSARFVWGLLSRNEDQMLKMAKANGVFTHMHGILNGPEGVAGLLEAYPHLRPVADTFVTQVLARCPDPEYLAEAYSLAARGQFTLGTKGEGVDFLRRLYELSEDDYTKIVRSGLADGSVAPDTLRVGDGFRPESFVIGRHKNTGTPEAQVIGFERFDSLRLDEAGDLTGSIMFRATNDDGSLIPGGAGALASDHFGPPRPSSYDGSDVVVLPADWHASAVLGEGVAKGVAPGAAERGMNKLVSWLEKHPEFHAVPEATSQLENTASAFIRSGDEFIPLADAVVNATPEGLDPQAMSALHMLRNGVTRTAIAEHFGVSRSTVSARIARAEAAIGEAGGVFGVKPGATLTDLNEVRKIGGEKFFHYLTSDGLDVWLRGDQGAARVAMAYDQMSSVTRLHALLRDLQAGTVAASAGADVAAAVVRNSDILARTLADPEIVSVLVRYGESIGASVDEIRLITRLLPGMDDTFDIRILTPRGAGRVQRAKFVTAAQGPSDRFSVEFGNMVERQRLFKSIEKGGSRTIWVKDFPTHPPKVIRKAGKLWRAHASNDGTSWWAYQRRLISAGFFNPKYKPTINLYKAGEGARSLGIFMRKIGARNSTIQEWVNRFIKAAPGDRYAIVRDCMEAMSSEARNPLFRFGMVDFLERQGMRTYASVGDEAGGFAELGLAFGRSAGDKKVVAVPWMPSHLSQYAVLPGDDFFRSMKRWHRTEQKLPIPGYNRGLAGWGATRARREKLAAGYINYMKSHNIDPSSITRLGKDSKEVALALAYATVGRGGKDKDLGGMGKVVHMARVLGKGYNVFHGFFSVCQLALRAPAWAFRVLLEEQFRSTFFDLPSVARNPFRMMASYFDVYTVNRVQQWQSSNATLLTKVLKDLWADAPATATPEVLLERARAVVPNIDQLLEGRNVTTASRVRQSVASVLQHAFIEETNADILKGHRFITRRAVRRVGHAKVGTERLRKMGLNPDFDWGDVDEIRNKGFAMRFIEDVTSSGSIPVQWAKNQMTSDQGEKYGVALGRSLHQMLNDPIMGDYALNRIVARMGHGAASKWDATSLVASRHWDDLRTNVRRMAEYAVETGKADRTILASDTMIAEWFLHETVDRYAEYLYGWLWRNADEDQALSIVSALARREATEVNIGSKTYLLSPGQHHLQGFTTTVGDIVREQSSLKGVDFPPTVTSHWKPQYLYEESPDTVTGWMKRGTQVIMAAAGDSLSQALNRRPAYLSAYKDMYRYLIERGFGHEAAQQAAHLAAVEKVNYVFYNMDNAVPFLRAMNKVSPFFTAWWEVAQTWAYKIPAIYGWPVGIAVLNRKVHRVMDAFVNVGLITVDAEADPSSPTGTRQMRLRFDPQANTGNPLGDVLSKAGHALLTTPVNVVRHFAQMANLFGPGDHDDYWSENIGKDVLTLAVGLPTDPCSHGLMAVNQIYLGLNPVGGFIAANTLNRIPFAVDYESTRTVEGETMAALAARLETTPSALYALNRRAIIDAVGADTAKKMFSGDLPADSIASALPIGTALRIPNSSLIENLIDPIMFPYGREETGVGSFMKIFPSWSQYMLRGWGLWSGVDTASGKGLDATDTGFFSLALTPETRSAAGGEILIQMQHLEAEEGLMTQVIEAEVDLARLKALYMDTLAIEGEGQSMTWNPNGPGADLFQAALDRAENLNAELLTRAMNMAGGAQVFRSLLGLVGPGIPQMLYHEQEVASAFHKARELIEAGPDFNLEEYMLPALRGTTEETARDIAVFNNMLSMWLQDPERGSFAKEYLKQNHPEILAFTMGRTYWGPSGEAPEVQSMNRYADDLRSGLRKAYSPEVFLQKYARASNAFSREVGVVARYGNDPAVAASRIVQDYATYRDYIKQFQVLDDSLDYADDLFNGAGYLEWRDRNRLENATLISELQRQAYLDIDVLEQWAVNADEVIGMSATERRAFVGQMKGVVSALRESLQRFQSEFDDSEITNPRQAVLATYFDEHVGAYYDHLGTLYDQIDTTTDSEARSRLFDEIRNYQNNEGMAPVYINDVLFPSVMEWWWGAKTSDEKESQFYRWVGTKPEWLSVFAAQKMVERNPEASAFLPDTLAEAQTYSLFNAADNALGDMFEPDVIGATLSPFSTGDRNKINAALEDVLVDYLRQSGRQGEADWREMLPIQRLHALNLLPQTLQTYLPQVNMVMEALAANEMTPGTQTGVDLFNLIYIQVMRDIEINPRVGQDLLFLGGQMFDETTYDGIFPLLFRGEYIGEI